MEAVLISAEALKKMPTFLQANIEDSIVRAAIYRTQDVMISPILGRNLYRRLCAAVKADHDGAPGGLNADEKKLINTMISDCLMAACEMRGVLHTTDQIRNKATGETNDEYLRAIEDKRMEKLMHTFRRDFDHYREELICYLKENYRLFPEYYSDGMLGACCIQGRKDNGRAYRNIHFI